MADKGFISGSMKFDVSDDEAALEQSEGPVLPMRLVVVTRLTPGADESLGATPPTAPIRLDPAEPEALFAKLRPRLSIEVPSVLDGGRMTRLEIAPTSLKSFRPDGLVTEVSLMRSLLDGKLVLDRLRAAEITDDQAFAQLDRLWKGSALAAEVLGRAPSAASSTAPAPAAPRVAAPTASEGGGLDSLLSMVEVPGGSGGDAPSAADSPAGDGREDRIARIIAEVASGGRKAGRGKSGIPRVEEAIGMQLGAILQHPAMRQLEQSYRALRFLLERAGKTPGLIVEAVAIGDDGPVAAFERVVRRADPPVTLALVDVDVDGSARSFADLEALAALAEANTCPVIVNGTSKLLGVGDLARVDKLDSKTNLFTAPHRAPWRATANKPSLRWVAIAMNPMLARLPYDKQSSRVREAVVVEQPNDHEAIVWIPPAYAVGATAIASFRDTSWPARITGPRHGVIENLPVQHLDDDGVEIAIPTQAFVSTESQRELSRVGVLMLASAANSDAAYIHAAPTAYVQPDKKTYDVSTAGPEDRPPPLSLVDQLFVGRLVQFARAICGKIPPDSDPKELEQVLQAATWSMFDKAPPSGPELAVGVRRSDEGLVASFSVRPRRFLGVSLDEFGFEMPVG
jgi:predicted component of type VI protein secretion system